MLRTKDQRVDAFDEDKRDVCVEGADEGARVQRRRSLKMRQNSENVRNGSRGGAEADGSSEKWRHPVQKRQQQNICSVSGQHKTDEWDDDWHPEQKDSTRSHARSRHEPCCSHPVDLQHESQASEYPLRKKSCGGHRKTGAGVNMYQTAEISVVVQPLLVSETCHRIQTATQFSVQKFARRNVAAFGGHGRTTLCSRPASAAFIRESAPSAENLDLRRDSEFGAEKGAVPCNLR